jgi:hypothetical protein
VRDGLFEKRKLAEAIQRYGVNADAPAPWTV